MFHHFYHAGIRPHSIRDCVSTGKLIDSPLTSEASAEWTDFYRIEDFAFVPAEKLRTFGQ